MHSEAPSEFVDREIARQSQRKKRRKIILFRTFGLFLLGFLTFAPLLKSGFLWNVYSESDQSLILKVEDLSSIWSIDAIRRYDPISRTSFYAEQVFLKNPATVHRAINITLHLVAALLLWSLLKRLKLSSAFWPSLLFAVHPAVIQTIFWPGYRYELIGTILMLSALSIYLSKLNSTTYLISILITIVAILVHPLALLIPIIATLAICNRDFPAKLKHLNPMLPVFCICSLLGTYLANIDPGYLFSQTVANWTWQAGRTFQFFLQQTFNPGAIKVFETLNPQVNFSLSAGINLLPFLVFPPLFALGIGFRKKPWARSLIFGLLLFLLFLIPIIFLPSKFIDGSIVLDTHRFYPALMIIVVLAFFSVRRTLQKLEIVSNKVQRITLGFTLLAFSILSFQFSYSVSKPHELWRTLASQRPESWKANLTYIELAIINDANNLKTESFILSLQGLLEDQPENLRIRKLLARTYMKIDQTNNALREYRRAFRDGVEDPEFIEEAILLFKTYNLEWDAENAKERLESIPLN